MVTAPAGSVVVPLAVPGADVYAWAHNETSTGALAPVERVAGADEGALVVVDGTSAAGGVEVDVSQTDVYYFAPQKSFGSEGGLWFALLSPAAVERVARVAAQRSLDPREPQPGHRAGELAPGPDPQHPVRRDAVPDARPAPLAARAGRARRRGRPHRGLGEPDLPLGRRGAVRDPVRRATRPTALRSSRRRLRRGGRGPARGDADGRTGSSTPSPTASSAATSCGSACSRTSTPTTSAGSAPASTGSCRASRRHGSGGLRASPVGGRRRRRRRPPRRRRRPGPPRGRCHAGARPAPTASPRGCRPSRGPTSVGLAPGVAAAPGTGIA